MQKTLFMICCSLLMLTGCSTTEVIDTWENDSQTKFTRIFVLAVVKEPAYRSLVENRLVDSLRENGVQAHAAYERFPNVDLIDESVIATAVKDSGVDGVMVVRLVDTKKETVYMPGTTYVDGGYGGRYSRGWYGYYGGGYRVMTTPGYTTEYSISTVESTIFDAVTNERAWSALTRTSETDVASAINSYTETMRKTLKSSGPF